MIVNSFTHYQTSFKAERRNSEHKPLPTIQNILYDWILQKESDNILRSNKDFFHKCNWGNLYRTHSSVATNIAYYGDGNKAWAMRYTHLDSKLGRGRYWHTDIGIKEEDRVATFYVRVSFAKSQYDLSLEHDIPGITTPRFIRDILSPRSGLSIYSRDSAFGLFDRPIPIKAGYGKALADWILSKDREYAMVVFNGIGLDLTKEAVSLARDLAGKAQVLVMDQDPELAEEVCIYLPKDLRIPFRKFRVFYPLNPEFPRPNRHRWFDISDPEYREKRAGLINSLLRNYVLEEFRAITNISEVGRLITFKKLKESAEAAGLKNEELDEFYEMFEEVEKERDDYKNEASRWAAEYDEKDSELNELKSKLYGLEQKQSLPPVESFNTVTDLHKLPQTLAEVVDIKSRMHADRLLFAEEAFTSASGYYQCEVIDKAWEILGHMAGTLYDLKFNSGKSVDLARVFGEKTGFEYARTEGRQTKANKALCNSRKITVDGKEYEIWPHVCHGNREPKMIRIHFAFDDELKKIVIGYVGPHMTNATTRKVG